MGFPENWTRVVIAERDVTRNDRLRMLGNAVLPQCGEAVGHVLGGLS